MRPSRLSAVFRRHAMPGGRLADWTRFVDGDWTGYCPHCAQIVVLIEEKGENALQKVWSVTRRLATRHEDRPWGWRVETRADGTFAVTGARAAEGHESFGPTDVDEDGLVRWIEKAFNAHYVAAGHPKRAAT